MCVGLSCLGFLVPPVKGESALKAPDVPALAHVHRGPNDSDRTEMSKAKLSNSHCWKSKQG